MRAIVLSRCEPALSWPCIEPGGCAENEAPASMQCGPAGCEGSRKRGQRRGEGHNEGRGEAEREQRTRRRTRETANRGQHREPRREDKEEADETEGSASTDARPMCETVAKHEPMEPSPQRQGLVRNPRFRRVRKWFHDRKVPDASLSPLGGHSAGLGEDVQTAGNEFEKEPTQDGAESQRERIDPRSPNFLCAGGPRVTRFVQTEACRSSCSGTSGPRNPSPGSPTCRGGVRCSPVVRQNGLAVRRVRDCV